MPLVTTTYIPFALPLFFAPSECRAAIDTLLPFPLPFSFPKRFSHTLFVVLPKMALSCSKVSSFSLSPIGGDVVPKKLSASLSFAFSPSLSLSSSSSSKSRNLRVFAAAGASNASLPLTGVIFEPFEEVKKDAVAVPITPNVSLARQNYTDESESAINEQINVEYSASYVYHSLFAYFDRDDVALRGFAKFFKESSEEEREHAEKLMKYQNIRGGRVVLHPIINPPSEFAHAEKGDALYAMELALSLEKLVNEKLLNLHSVADHNNDPQLCDFIESEFLHEQVKDIKRIAEYVTQLRMVGKGHGVWHFDQRLLHEEGHAHI